MEGYTFENITSFKNILTVQKYDLVPGKGLVENNRSWSDSKTKSDVLILDPKEDGIEFEAQFSIYKEKKNNHLTKNKRPKKVFSGKINLEDVAELSESVKNKKDITIKTKDYTLKGKAEETYYELTFEIPKWHHCSTRKLDMTTNTMATDDRTRLEKLLKKYRK